MTTITEHDVEHTVLDRLADFGWQIAYGPDIAPDAPNAERTGYGQVMLEQWVRASLSRLKPDRPAGALAMPYEFRKSARDPSRCRTARPDASTAPRRSAAALCGRSPCRFRNSSTS